MKYLIISLSVILLNLPSSLNACTGLSLKAKDGAYVQARTIEWGSSDLPSEYVIIPRRQQITYPDRRKRRGISNQIRRRGTRHHAKRVHSRRSE